VKFRESAAGHLDDSGLSNAERFRKTFEQLERLHPIKPKAFGFFGIRLSP